jgi:hypothetical protein
MKIFKQIDLCFIFQRQKPKVQSCFLNHQKLKTMKLLHPLKPVIIETSIMHSSSLGWNFPLCRVPLSGVEALPKSALMSAFISVSTRSAFAAAFCNADHKDKKLFTSKTYPRLHDKEPRGYTSLHPIQGESQEA